MTIDRSPRTSSDARRDDECDVRYELDEDESLAEGVVVAASAASNVGALDLDPLYSAVDPDALNAVFESMNGRGTLSFSYSGFCVVADGDGTVTLRAEST